MAQSSKQDKTQPPPMPVKPDTNIGERPPRRRPAMNWDKVNERLARDLHRWQIEMREAGYCPDCEKYFGRALSLHKGKCKS